MFVFVKLSRCTFEFYVYGLLDLGLQILFAISLTNPLLFLPSYSPFMQRPCHR